MMTKLTFEQAMEQLEEIVQLLERGEAPLEQSIELYKKGMELSALCKGQLERAEKQIMTVVQENGEQTTLENEESVE